MTSVITETSLPPAPFIFLFFDGGAYKHVSESKNSFGRFWQ